MLAVNVLGPFLCCREAVLRMSTRHGGSGGAIVLVSSAATRLGSAGEYVDYAASKGAIDTLGLGLAREVAQEGVRVNVVRPGFIDTEIHEPGRLERVVPQVPMARPGRAEEVAAAITWLLGDSSAYTTGALLDVSGGR
jgi:NAD(P)-dependent dehydrogenase (short-subunit alcohol dehydrogenase family)